MSGGFQATLPVGGTIDKVRGLPHPLFASKYTPLAVGKQLPIPAVTTVASDGSNAVFTDSYSLPFDTEVTAISIWNSSWSPGDYWDLWLGDIHICQKIYTKTVPQTIPMGQYFGLVFPMAANSQIKFQFTNGSGTAKTVAWDVKFLYDQPEGQPPLIP